MSRQTPRKSQTRGNQSQPSISQSTSHSGSQGQQVQQDQQQYQQQDQVQGHARSRSHQLLAQRRAEQERVASLQLQLQLAQAAQTAQAAQAATSDYESETAHYMASNPTAVPALATALASRTNTDLNLRVLKRYLPSITSILSIAANAVVYSLDENATWIKSNMEGTMFICSQGGEDGVVGENGCLFMLNRKGLQNFVVDLNKVKEFELNDPYFMFKFKEEDAPKVYMENGEAVTTVTVGVWTFAEEEAERVTNAALIYEMWTKVCEAREKRAAAGVSEKTAEAGPAAQAMDQGRKLSVSDLFKAGPSNAGPSNGTR
ncbi:Uu.00g050660.m01.CDS01 [Anthostomella pinea]|uniref:Uu.00g050660.m01.CDS01 n=1 Tax=Anthostomella pinea TaxID=933095 RepID=A0AAI8VTH7_9PEZI|nr:Uu.00g050660.m01.CDS01 [Anthostomella pinea]